jgi:hypothetical protein
MKGWHIKHIIFVLVFSPAVVWAGLTYDLDKDCDVDGLDLQTWASGYHADLEDLLSEVAAEFGTVGCSSEPIGIDAVVDGFPNWEERALLVFTNMARMAPIEYRDAYMTSYVFPAGGILNSYPPVPPVRWNKDLNRGARFHAEDMAYNCEVLQHDSCDGTIWNQRICSFYPRCPCSLGENVAYGYLTPWTVLNAFLCDRYGSSCAPDGSGLDGHRANIMGAAYKEIGTGYARSYAKYWVQDFAGCLLGQQPPIVAAAHAFPDEGITSFFLNYYDETGAAPRDVSLVLDSRKYPLRLDIGAASAGTFRADFETASDCQSYYFQVTDGNGLCYRYPGAGAFLTYGEGDCLVDYAP